LAAIAVAVVAAAAAPVANHEWPARTGWNKQRCRVLPVAVNPLFCPASDYATPPPLQEGRWSSVTIGCGRLS